MMNEWRFCVFLLKHIVHSFCQYGISINSATNAMTESSFTKLLYVLKEKSKLPDNQICTKNKVWSQTFQMWHLYPGISKSSNNSSWFFFKLNCTLSLVHNVLFSLLLQVGLASFQNSTTIWCANCVCAEPGRQWSVRGRNWESTGRLYSIPEESLQWQVVEV